MAIRKFRFDPIQVARHKPALPPQREDREPVRLLTPISFARTLSGIHGFRVVAEREEGPDALVCLGATRDEVLECVRGLVAQLPADTVQLRLEEWQGGTCSGLWRRQPCRRGEARWRPPSAGCVAADDCGINLARAARL